MKNSNQNIIKYKAIKKTVITFLALAFISVSSYSQSIFDKFEDMEGVGSVILNQKMFRMLATMGVDSDDPDTQEFIDMASNITSFKVFTADNASIAADMKTTVNKYLKSKSLEELMRVKKDGQTVKFYVKEGKDENHVKELLMFVSGLKEITKNSDIEINGKKPEIESVIMSLTGDIDLRQVSKIADKMDVPGGEQLKNATKKQ